MTLVYTNSLRVITSEINILGRPINIFNKPYISLTQNILCFIIRLYKLYRINKYHSNTIVELDISYYIWPYINYFD